MTKEQLKTVLKYCVERQGLYIELTELKEALIDAEIKILENPSPETKTAFRLAELRVKKAESLLKTLKCPIDPNNYEIGERWESETGHTVEVCKYFRSKYFKLTTND